MDGIAPELNFKVQNTLKSDGSEMAVKLKFKSIEDFQPDKVAEQVAYEVMYLGMHKDVVPKSTLFFHSINIDPLWPYKKVAIIGGHVFYSKAKKPKESAND
jgi:hypothetical protein